MEDSFQKEEMLFKLLQCAARGDMEEISKTLTCHPDLINAQHSESGDTALIVAARQNQPEVIAVLLDHGADVTLHNFDHHTALHVANEVIREQLLSAIKRISFPQLSLAQAAWQGDLDTILDLLSTDSSQDVNNLNAQGLTPLVLAVRDVDLLEGLSMERKYNPVSVLEELLKRHGDAHLLDLNGNSAMSYACQVKSHIRQQLMDALEKSLPPPETLDEDFCGFCPDTKPTLSDRADSTLGRVNSQNTLSVSEDEPACDVVVVRDINQWLEAEEEVRICSETEEARGASLQDLENNPMDERKKNSLSAQWLPNISPQHLTPRPFIKKHPSLPPLHMKKDEKDVQLERLGLGYLFHGSHSYPNIPEAQLEVDPLRNFRYIKEHIRQRLSSGESTESSKAGSATTSHGSLAASATSLGGSVIPRQQSMVQPPFYCILGRMSTVQEPSLIDTIGSIYQANYKLLNARTFPPVCYSPRSPKFYRPRPLPKSSSRDGRTERSVPVFNDKSRDNNLTYRRSVLAPAEGLDMVLSKDQGQSSLAGITSAESANHICDRSSKSAPLSIRNRYERREDKKGSMNHDTIGLPHICNRILELTVKDMTPRSSWSKETLLSLEDEPFAVQSNGTLRDKPSDHKDNELITNCEKDLLKHETDLLHSSMINKNTNDNHIEMPLNDNRLLDLSKVIESIKMSSPRTPRASHVPFVHITFSEQEAKTEAVHLTPAKQFLTKKKPNLSTLTHTSRSFNINAQKEIKRKKTKKARKMSAPNVKYPRPLSNSNGNCVKCAPLPTLVYSSSPLSSKMSKKAGSKPGSAERNSQRSQTQLSLYTKKRLNSPVHSAMPPRANSAHDYQDIHYSDMFVEIKPQNNGPGIFQMFETPVYINTSKDTKCRKETSSASSTRSCSSKGEQSSSSRESSARSSKKAKPRNKRKSSATNHQRKSSLTKSVAAEDISEHKNNMVIISGTDWEIKTIKQEGRVGESTTGNPTSSTSHLTHPDFSDLSIIKEATIENSLTGNEAAHIILFKKFQEVEVNYTENFKNEHVDPETAVERNEVENVVHPAKSSEKDEEERGPLYETGHLGQPPEKPCAAEQPSEEVQLLQGETTLLHLVSRENEDEILIEDSDRERSQQLYCISAPMKSTHNSGTSDMLISFGRGLRQMDEEFNDSKTLQNHQDNDQSANVHHSQCSDKARREEHLIQISRCTSPNGSNTNTSNHSENYFEPSNDDSSFHWIKGEVLGKGAYGTVYRGLTSQGELIAAKQVMLHGSDPSVAEKEYRKLQEEVDLLKILKHDNIVGYLGTCLQDNVVTIFMEFVPGGSIASIVRHFGPLQEVVISKYTNHILQGIAYLHKNRVVHRDIKGNNVMLMPNGVIKLIDFGCAKRLNGLNMNGTLREMLKSMHGTPYWMAPEVISESGHGEKSDIWSIGCTVFEMATGKPPLAHMNKMAAMYYIAAQKGLMPTLPDHFSKKARDFVNLCLIREQEDRPSAEQLIQHAFTRENNSPQKHL